MDDPHVAPKRCLVLRETSKTELKDKGGEETDKVRKNILEYLASNRTTLGIKIRSVPINKEEEAK